jgi:methionyl-tRNA formyltransferase
MRIAFMGTPDFAVPSLERLAAEHEVVLVVTRPDAVRSRGKRLEASPVAEAAGRLGLPTLKCKRMDDEVIARIREAAPDACCVAAFGCIIPDEVLGIAPLGCVNVHASLLPRWRGAAPIQRAMLAGDERVGVSIMRVVHELDAGAFCRQASIEVGELTCSEVTRELARIGADQLVGALSEMAAGTCAWQEQDASQATYAAKVDKAELLLDPELPADENVRRVQSSLDASPARLSLAGRGLRALRARLAPERLEAGEVRVVGKRLVLGCPDASFELLELKPDGKRAMPASAFVAGLRGDGLAWGSVR